MLKLGQRMGVYHTSPHQLHSLASLAQDNNKATRRADTHIIRLVDWFRLSSPGARHARLSLGALSGSSMLAIWLCIYRCIPIMESYPILILTLNFSSTCIVVRICIPPKVVSNDEMRTCNCNYTRSWFYDLGPGPAYPRNMLSIICRPALMEKELTRLPKWRARLSSTSLDTQLPRCLSNSFCRSAPSCPRGPPEASCTFTLASPGRGSLG